MIALAAQRPLAGGFTRRGACPALSAPMKTGDGLLVRLNPVANGLSPAQLAALCDAAAHHGNGVIEITARGSIQIRGLRESSTASFAHAVDRLGISVRTGVPVQIGILAGLDPDEVCDPTALAEKIREAIAKTGLEGRLGPKVSVVIDGGGRTALEEVAADVRLTATAQNEAPAWQVAVAGDANTARAIGVAADDAEACKATLAMLSAIAVLGRAARAHDLGAGRLSNALNELKLGHPALSASNKPCAGGSLIGTMALSDAGVAALGIALPFGHTTAKRLKTLAEAPQALGVEDIRPAPKRTMVAICRTRAAAIELRKKAETLGFVVSADDPRTMISACPGAPDCASGHIPARGLAAEIANDHKSLLDGSVHLHVSGCAKGCAHPAPSNLVLVGSETGMGLIPGGTARDEPHAFVANDGARRALAGMAARLSAERRAGETTAQTIQRVGVSALAEGFRQGGT
jgi:precorrin-3B synthase